MARTSTRFSSTSTAFRSCPLPEPPNYAPTPGIFDGLRILVVDDEEDARDLLRFALEHCSAKVSTAGSAAEALATIEKVRPDVIVSDIGMPQEDGYAFVRKLRERPRDAGGETPAIALTAYARPDDKKRALVAGFQRHAAKPIELQELFAVISDVLAGNGKGASV
jgi:CheY-like chemotaxis protein